MNYTTIANVMGKLLMVTGCSMVFPLICSLYYNEDDLYAITVTAIITIVFSQFSGTRPVAVLLSKSGAL